MDHDLIESESSCLIPLSQEFRRNSRSLTIIGDNRTKKDFNYVKSEKKRGNPFKIILTGLDGTGKTTIAKHFAIKIENDKSVITRDQLCEFIINQLAICDLSFSFSNQIKGLKEKNFRPSDIFDNLYYDIVKFFHDHQSSFEFTYLEFFIKRLEKYSNANYIPNIEDYMHFYSKDEDLNGIAFEAKTFGYKRNFKIFDTTDAADRKGIPINLVDKIDHMATIIYCVSVCDYDKPGYLDQSIGYFKRIISGPFNNNIFVLSLNKTDIFREKIKKYPLSKYLDDNYKSSFINSYNDTYLSSLSFMKSLFLKIWSGIHHKDDRFLYTSTINATDIDENSYPDTIIRIIESDFLGKCLDKIGL